MKKALRILSFMLVLVMMVSALAACGGKKDPVETQKPSTSDKTPSTKAPTTGSTPATQAPAVTEEPAVDKWAGVNFNGTEIIMNLNNWEPTSVVNAGATNGIKYIQGPDEYTTDMVQNAVYDRNQKVLGKLGLNVKYNHDTYPSVSTLPTIENFVLSDLEDSPDIMQAPGYDMVRAAIKGLLYNALTKEEKNNYFDLTEENGWYTDFMYENTLDKDKLFLLVGDYFIDVLRFSYGVFVNIDMYDDLFASEGGIESLYETVQSGNWDYEELIRCADAAYIDNGTVGSVDEEDVFGIAAGVSWYYRNFFSTSGLDIFEEKDGKIAYAEDISDVHTFVDKLIEMVNRDSFLNPHNYGKGAFEAIKLFTSGNSLFALDQFVLNLEGTNVRNMDAKVGIVPFPKYNKDIEYGALVSDNANLGGILYNSDKFVESSALLQMMCEESNGGKGTLMYEYYDVTLKYKYSADVGQIAMLELIRSGLCSPKAMLFDNYFVKNVGLNTYGVLMTNSIKNGTNTFASDWASQYAAAQQSLEDTYKIFGVQE